jgi:methylglyoxal synthase
MAEFAMQYEQELDKFDHILATGTTGREVGEAAPALQHKIKRFHSGPKGGDIQIATEILFARCDVIVFFLDPLRPHPHADDIRVVLAACMVENNVRILTNEVEARDWMEEVVRRGHLPEALQRIRRANSPRREDN